MSDDANFFSVAMTTPFLALIPKDVSPLATAAKAFSIWGSLPFEAKVVSEKSAIFKIYLNLIKYLNRILLSTSFYSK